jgi:DNA invertase Pin-like site-specific DNA recombinase
MDRQIDYARVGTSEQSPDFQLDELNAAGCKKIITYKIRHVRAARPGLDEFLDRIRGGDISILLRLDWLRPSRSRLVSIRHRIEQAAPNP